MNNGPFVAWKHFHDLNTGLVYYHISTVLGTAFKLCLMWIYHVAKRFKEKVAKFVTSKSIFGFTVLPKGLRKN